MIMNLIEKFAVILEFILKNVDDLKNKIDLIEKDSSSYLKFKEEVYHRVRKEYSWKDISGKYAKLFDSELEGIIT